MEQNILVRVGADITNFSRNMDKATKGITEFRKANADTFDSFKQVGTAITAAGVGIAAGLGYAVNEASTFQSAFASVRKTVDGSEADYAKLEQGIRNMAKELPASADSIAEVAASAGQLGIEKDAILAFTRTMIDLGESTNLTAEEAATSFARFANITKMPQDNFDELGSTVVKLGNNLATTEAEIVSMSMRLAAQSTQVGMSQAQIMGLAGAMSSVGINAEAGGTSMSLVLKKMQTDVGKGGKALRKWADIAGMSASEFKTAFEDDAAGALNAVVLGLGEAGSEGKNMAAILADVGVKGQYEADTMMRLAGAGELLGDSLAIANEGWTENTALTDEAAQRYETFESKLAILKNTFNDLAITVGDVLLPTITTIVEKFTEFVNWIGQLNPKLLTAGTVIAAVAAGLALIIGPILLLIGFIPSIVAGFASVVTVVKAVGAALALLTTPIGLVIAAVVGLAILIYAYWDEIKAYTIQAWGAISTFFAELWTQIKETASVAWASFTSMLSEVWAGIQEAAAIAWQVISDVVMAIVQPFIDGILNLWNGMKDGITTVMEGLSLFFSGIWEIIKNIFLGAILLIINLVTGDFEEMKSNASAIMDNLKSAINTVWEGIKKIFSGAVEAVKGFVKAAWENIKSTTTTVWETIKSTISTVWNNVKTTVSEAATNVWNTIKRKFEDIRSAIEDKMKAAWETIKSVWNDVMAFFEGIDLAQIGKDIIQGLINGITSKVTAVANAVKSVTDAITGKIKGILGIASPSKVTTQFGRWTGEGLALGMEDERNRVARAAETLTEAASANITPTLDYSASTSGIAAALNGSVGIRDERDNALLGAISGLRRDLTNLRVEMDGQAVGRIAADGVNERNAETAHARRYFG